MKTILYNPIFINPLAYYVFPRLTRYLQPDNESTAEPANYIGTIEVKVIAYGDTTLKRTYTNTDSIDLSEFKNTWIRISLFTKVGSCVLGEWKIGNMESDLPYIDPEVLASLKAVVIVGNKTNNDSDRAIVKNLVDPDNPFVISNAAFKLNSGFGKYSADFESFDWAVNISQKQHNKATISLNGRLCNHAAIEVDEMKVNIIGNVTELIYWYIANPDDTTRSEIRLTSGINTLPKSYAKDDGQTYNIGFAYISGDSEITIEQIPSFEGAFVTDGIDDLIKSTKSATEMLDGSNEVTVVSMIHQIKTNDDATRNNWFFTPVSYLENRVVKDKIGKTGIYGYTSTNVTNAQISDITPILGDKNDYTLYSKIEDGDRDYFTVEGFQNQGIWYVSSIAWYWTIIANKVLTTDQINQVIAYFNLDRTLKPDILCDVKKQGITNENHAEFGDRLIDFSGNGRDIQLNNIAWKGDSGIGKYEVDFLDSSIWNSSNSTITSSKIDCKNAISHIMLLYYSVGSKEYPDIPSFKVIKTGADIDYSYIDETGSPKSVKIVDGVNILPASHNTLYSGSGRFCGFGNPGMGNSVTITQIPSHAGGLCLDGVNDFGKVTGMPVYKDYTFIIDYERISYALSEKWVACVVSKSHVANQGAFILMTANTEVEPGKQAYSFGGVTPFNRDDFTRALLYQSKYKCGDVDLTVGEGVDCDTLWLGTFRDNDQRFFNGAIYSLMSFPYSMSEFLLERQLKRYKLGTLYPDMVEFRPIVKSNVPYKQIDYFIRRSGSYVRLNPGDYFSSTEDIIIRVTPIRDWQLDVVSSIKVNGKDEVINVGSYTQTNPIHIDKSPQKIEIQIDEYIRYENIVQPYPYIVKIRNNDGYIYTYGDKLKVGSEIIRGVVINLLPELYSVGNGVFLNGQQITNSEATIIVSKNMVFTHGGNTYLKANEPNCIADPQRLRIPNSSYKILGYIPDISGHGNHLKINNSAYAGMSGANGYSEDFTTWLKSSGVKVDNDKIEINASTEMWLLRQYTTSASKFKVNVVGIPNNGTLKYGTISNPQQLHNGINELDAFSFDALTDIGFFKTGASANDWIGLIIQQIGEYEGSFCLDGVEDYLTIPTLSHGAKQVLMKVNWQEINRISYDQRGSGNAYVFAIYTSDEGDVIAYNTRNNGKTYIDGVLNSTVMASQLKNITHNIAITNDNVTDANSISPRIGCSNATTFYSKMALFAFMSFDDISSEDEIKELNDIVGIEGGYVESPDYYWDAYGKSNIAALDIDYQDLFQSGNSHKMLIDKSKAGLAALELYHNSGNNSELINRRLVANNFAYNEESGYGGISTIYKFSEELTSSQWKYYSPRVSFEVLDDGNSVRITEVKSVDALFYIGNPNKKAYYKVTGINAGKGIKFGSDRANSIWSMVIEEDGIYEVDWSLNINSNDEMTSCCIMSNGWTGECNITIEQVAQYQNGLVSDGVDDELKNEHMPVLTDYTWIMKRKRLNGANSTVMAYKGNSPGSMSFMFELVENDTKNTRSFGTNSTLEGFADLISYQTKNSYNGTVIPAGDNADGNNLFIFRSREPYQFYCKGVFYKAMLYSKTIDQLSINMLKNLFEKDELIDVNNPIFKQNN